MGLHVFALNTRRAVARSFHAEQSERWAIVLYCNAAQGQNSYWPAPPSSSKPNWRLRTMWTQSQRGLFQVFVCHQCRPHSPLGKTFCALKEHQPLNLFFFSLRYTSILLTSCLCHTEGNRQLSARFAVRTLCPHTKHWWLPSFLSVREWCQVGPQCCVLSVSLDTLRALSLQGQRLCSRAMLGWTGHRLQFNITSPLLCHTMHHL